MGRRIGSLFSGAGGLDLAVQEVFSGEVVWHAEIDKAASKVLAHRFPGVPNLGDISAVDWADVPAVDVLCGGFPCQDVSAAGKRAGIKAGTRSGLWSVFADAIDALRPQWVVIENVRGLLSATAHRTVDDADSDMEPAAGVMGNGAGRPVLRAAGAVLGDLADLGYDAQWATVAAADVGAPHRRERVFVVAHTADNQPGVPAGDVGNHGLQGEPQPLDAAGFRAGNRNSAGNPASRVQFLGRGARCKSHDAPHSPRNGWDEGRPESARLVGGFDAAVSGDEPGVALLPTPCAQQSGNSPEEHLRKKPGRKVVTDLAILVENGLMETGGALPPTGERTVADGRQACGCGDRRIDHDWFVNPDRFDDGGCRRCRCEGFWPSADEPAVALLPTPNAQDGNGGGRYSSEGHQSTLPGEVRLLPTPRVGGGGDCESERRRNSPGLESEVAMNYLPTPAASDCTGGGQDPDRRAGHTSQLIDEVLSTQWGKYEPAIRRWQQIVGPAPAPTEPNKNGNPRLSAAFSEWLMGWPQGWVTHPAISISRNDQLRIIGNGVCPQQATAALRFLLPVSEVTP